MRVFLIHGMGRSRASMALLGARLKRAGHLPSSFGYTVSTTSFADIVDHFVDHVGAVLRRDAGPREASPMLSPEPYAIIGHSLGNIITRQGSPRLPAGFCRFVMLAPPNSSPRLARLLSGNPLFRLLAGDPGQRLADPAFYAQLPTPQVPTLILAGDGGPRARWLPFDGAPSDGVVALDETELADVPLKVVPAIHTFIMNHRGATRDIHHFLESGKVDDATLRA